MLTWLIPSLIAFVTPPGAPAASTPGTVEGHVQYEATSVPMTYVYARETRPSPTGNEPPQVVILITDRPAPAEIVGSRQAYYAATREDRIRGILLVLARESSPPRLAVFAAGGWYDDTTVPDTFNEVELTALVRQRGIVSGRLRTRQARELGYGDEGIGPRRYALDLRFRTPIAPAPQPTEILTGAAARTSPQAAAALRSLQLLHSGSIADIRAQLAPDHPMHEALASAQGQALLRMARENLPAPQTYLQSVERVIVYGDEAVVVARDREGPSDVSLRRQGGEWKMARSPIPND